jgi:hypothetical protein
VRVNAANADAVRARQTFMAYLDVNS